MNAWEPLSEEARSLGSEMDELHRLSVERAAHLLQHGAPSWSDRALGTWTGLSHVAAEALRDALHGVRSTGPTAWTHSSLARWSALTASVLGYSAHWEATVTDRSTSDRRRVADALICDEHDRIALLVVEVKLSLRTEGARHRATEQVLDYAAHTAGPRPFPVVIAPDVERPEWRADVAICDPAAYVGLLRLGAPWASWLLPTLSRSGA